MTNISHVKTKEDIEQVRELSNEHLRRAAGPARSL